MASEARKAQQLRIIGGRWRGRKFTFPEAEGLRPTGDRIRETLFNWIAPELPQSRCLDLFAGSGALGLEALSRGAGHVEMWEKNKKASQMIEQHLKTIGSEMANQTASITAADSLTRLQQKNPGAPYHLVFMDPPFAANMWQECIENLSENEWLAEGAHIYVESPKGFSVQIPSNWQALRSKQAGQVNFQLFYCDK